MMINAGLLCLITTFLHGKVDIWDFLNLLTVFNGEAKNVEEPYQAMSSSLLPFIAYELKTLANLVLQSNVG